jgi:hypothetical protein
MKWYNPFSYFSATADDLVRDGEDVAKNAAVQAAAPVKEEANPVAALFFLIIVGVFMYLFYSNCRPIGQRIGKNGKMETIYDCTGKPPVQPVMYAQPQQVMYAQPQQVVYAQPQPVMYAQPMQPVVQQQPGGIFGFGRRR